MRWRTFNRLMDRANQLSREADVAAPAGLARLGFFSWDDAYTSVLGDAGIETTDPTEVDGAQGSRNADKDGTGVLLRKLGRILRS